MPQRASVIGTEHLKAAVGVCCCADAHHFAAAAEVAPIRRPAAAWSELPHMPQRASAIGTEHLKAAVGVCCCADAHDFAAAAEVARNSETSRRLE